MSKSPFNGVWNKLDSFTPGLIRLLATARSHGHSRALSDQEIADQCSLSLKQIQVIQWEKRWDTITYSDMKEFFKGCGFDLNNRRDVAYISGKLSGSGKFKWKHLHCSAHHRFFEKLLRHNLE